MSHVFINLFFLIIIKYFENEHFRQFKKLYKQYDKFLNGNLEDVSQYDTNIYRIHPTIKHI
jgi:hypothetical protein